MIQKYRKKPVVIEAVKWAGNNEDEIVKFCGRDKINLGSGRHGWYLTIKTLEGWMYANIGDYIIKGVKGEFYPCEPDIFKLTYERVK